MLMHDLTFQSGEKKKKKKHKEDKVKAEAEEEVGEVVSGSAYHHCCEGTVILSA